MTPAERAAAFERILRPALAVLADPASPAGAVDEARATLAEVTRLTDALHGGARQGGSGRSPETAAPRDAPARARMRAREDPAQPGTNGLIRPPRMRAREDPAQPGTNGLTRPPRMRAREDPAEAARRQVNGERRAEGLHGIRKGRRQCEATTRNGGRCKAPAVPGGAVCRRHGGEAPQVRVQAAMTARYEARARAAEAWEAARGTPGEFGALCAWSRADNAVKDGEAKMERIRELRARLRKLREEAP